ncbi:hypothetical protein DER46DRAFT_505717 [Fusarium sp. MPI-SDFR-AT-0072]|nr:hypothetical protein DER46DRAFT_505717 [Fusarium sp. MPI-SDFR-AT-0072]
MERQEQQSLPDAETECIIKERSEAIETQDQRNPLPTHDMEEEPATKQIEQSEAAKGQDQQILTYVGAEYASEQGERVGIKERTETMEIRDQRTPPPMQHMAQQTESSEASERQQSLPDIGVEYTNKQAYQVGIEEQAETMRRRDERTPPPMQHTEEESTAQQTEPSEVSEGQQGQQLRIKETEIMRRQDQWTPPQQDIPGQSRAPESPPPQIPKPLAGIKRKRDYRPSEPSSSHSMRVKNHLMMPSDPQPVVPPQPAFPTIYGRIRRDQESIKIRPVRRLQPQRDASKDTGGASKSRG